MQDLPNMTSRNASGVNFGPSLHAAGGRTTLAAPGVPVGGERRGQPSQPNPDHAGAAAPQRADPERAVRSRDAPLGAAARGTSGRFAHAPTPRAGRTRA